MPSEAILLKAKASSLGIQGFRTMDLDALKAAIKTAEATGSAPVKGKGKSSTNGASANGATVTKGKSTPAKGKGKTASKSAPAKKSTARKTAPAKGKAVPGKAKRQTAVARSAAKTTTAKAKKTTAAKGSTSRRSSKPKRVEIDRTQIDWKAETNVGGRGGKREDVMNALIKYKGNYDKCYDALEPQCLRWYPNALNTYPTAPSRKHAAQLMLRWLINRVALDFVRATGQHTSGVRAGYGQSDNPQDVRRRERRAENAKARAKEARAAKRGKK